MQDGGSHLHLSSADATGVVPVRPPDGLSPQPGNWEVCAGTARLGCQPRRGLLGSESWPSRPSAGCGGGSRCSAGRQVYLSEVGASRASLRGNGVSILEIGAIWTAAFVLRSFLIHL